MWDRLTPCTNLEDKHECETGLHRVQTWKTNMNARQAYTVYKLGRQTWMWLVRDRVQTWKHRFMQRAVFPSSGRVFAFQDGGFCRYPSTGRRRQTGRPNARPRTGCITRRTYFLRIIFKVLRLVYYCASVEADFYSFSYRTSCDLVARDQNLSPLAQPGFWRWLPAGRNRLCLQSCSIVCLVIVPIPINRWPSGNGSSSRDP